MTPIIKTAADITAELSDDFWRLFREVNHGRVNHGRLTPVELSEIPVIDDIHMKVCRAVTDRPDLFEMQYWHFFKEGCGTTHCRAGWVNTLAGPKGEALEKNTCYSLAAALIYLASDPNMKEAPSFHSDNKDALHSIRAAAIEEQDRKRELA